MAASVDQLIDGFLAEDLDAESRLYLRTHGRRYRFLVGLVERLAPSRLRDGVTATFRKAG